MVRSFEPPVYCYHEIVHNQLDRRALRGARASCSSTTSPTSRRARRSCCRPTARRPRSSPRPRPAAATSSTRSARSSPRCTTRCASAPARATASCTSATRATRRRSARWPSRPSAISRVERVADVAALPQFDEPVALLAQTTLVAPRLGGRRRRRPRALPRRVVTGAQRPLLRHDQPAVGADGARRAVRRDRRHRLGELLQHARPREAGRARPAASSSPASTTPPRSPTRSSAARIVGVTAGASAPDELVDAGHRAARSRRGRRGRRTSPTRTSTSRRRASCASCRRPIESAATVMLGGSMRGRPRMDDRALSASDVLSALAGSLSLQPVDHRRGELLADVVLDEVPGRRERLVRLPGGTGDAAARASPALGRGRCRRAPTA